MSHTALRICPLCEATCGLVLSIDDGRISGARGDRDDVFSHGFICPKGASFAELDNDPDRLIQPMVRRDGELLETTWEDAFAAVAEGLGRVIADTGGSSVGVYLGNPNAHTIAGALYGPAVIRALGTRAIFSARCTWILAKVAASPCRMARQYVCKVTPNIRQRMAPCVPK
jgi:anaerobic selenocysteine-containing dehydrogenase